MAMAAKNDGLDLELPAEILGLGQAFAAIHAGIRVSYRPGVQQPTAEQMDALVDKVLGLVRANPTARRLIGIMWSVAWHLSGACRNHVGSAGLVGWRRSAGGGSASGLQRARTSGGNPTGGLAGS